MLARLIRANCALLAAHTNADVVGNRHLGDLASRLGLVDVRPIGRGRDPAPVSAASASWPTPDDPRATRAARSPTSCRRPRAGFSHPGTTTRPSPPSHCARAPVTAY